MKTQLARVAAILLLTSSTPLLAAEPPFHAPSTHRAQETAQLLHRAARALYDSAPDASAISDLWVFPTADPDTVFAQYRVSAIGQSVTTEHLVVLTLQGDRILSMRELTNAVAEATLEEATSPSQTRETRR